MHPPKCKCTVTQVFKHLIMLYCNMTEYQSKWHLCYREIAKTKHCIKKTRMQCNSYNPKPEVSKTPKYLTTYLLPKKSQNNYFILNCLCTCVQSSSFEMFAVRLVWVCVQIYRSQHVLSDWSECFSCSHRRLLCCLLYICPHIVLLFILLEVQCVLYSVFILQFLQRFPSHLFAKVHTSYNHAIRCMIYELLNV